MIIGPSNGWLYVKKIYSLFQHKAILKKVGFSALEICFSSEWHSEDNRKRMISLSSINESFDVQTLAHRSVHLPDIIGQETGQEISMAQKVVSCCRAAVALTHPLKSRGDYPIKSYETMIESGVPLAIENMDIRKDSGFDLKELEKLLTFVGCFVLDVQHAFERDPTMEYAFDLFEMAKTRLAYLHVSGETPDRRHALTFQSRNCDQIVSFLGTIFSEIQVPIILEGEYSTAEELSQEINFLTKELNDK
jgi:hypothetical protein